MGVLISDNLSYNLEGFSDNELIRWNRLQNNIDEIFDNAIIVGKYD